MTENKHCNYFHLDPRTKILLLLISNVLLFASASLEVICIHIVVLVILLLLSGCHKPLLRFCIVETFLLGINFIVFPIAPKLFTMMFSISVNYGFKMAPCLMAGILLACTTSLHDVVLAMRKWRLPQKLIITLTVTIRYFPAIFEEIKHIANAMKLREIPLSSKVECFIVPFMVAASTTVEELSAAAVTRGIDNPAPKTSAVRLRFSHLDYLVFLAGAGIITAALML